MISDYGKFLHEKLNKGKWYQRFLAKVIHLVRPNFFREQYLTKVNKMIDKVFLDRVLLDGVDNQCNPIFNSLEFM